MGARPSKIALAEAARLLESDKNDAREYLRGLQRLAGSPIPYTVLVEAMKNNDSNDVTAIVRQAKQYAARPR